MSDTMASLLKSSFSIQEENEVGGTVNVASGTVTVASGTVTVFGGTVTMVGVRWLLYPF